MKLFSLSVVAALVLATGTAFAQTEAQNPGGRIASTSINPWLGWAYYAEGSGFGDA